MTSPQNARPRASRREMRARADTLAQLVHLVWAHKLWWVVPLLLSLAVLGLLILVQATPIGPLLYPVF